MARQRLLSILVNLGAAAGFSPTEKGTDDCGLYLAETTDDHGRQTMGVFTGVDIAQGSLVGSPDVIVPLIDMPIHNSVANNQDHEPWWVNSDGHMLWDALRVGGEREGVHVRSAAIGSLVRINSNNDDLSNAILTHSEFDAAGLHRSSDPGAGAFSYYADSAMMATHDIPAGSELLLSSKGRHSSDPTFVEGVDRGTIKRTASTDPRVQEFYRNYLDFERMHEEELSPLLRSKIWTIIQTSPLDRAVRSSLPTSWENAKAHAQAIVGQDSRSTPWLQHEHGICLDNIRQGLSSIAQAGRGAFATRDLPKGSIIAPAKIFHISDKSTLDMIGSDGATNSKQLLLNYCFGHEESKHLLCPIGPGTSFINHSPKPNAAVRWTTSSTGKTQNSDKLNNRVLMMEYVATRDIQQGEEIFIHYGSTWENAWDEHVRTWSPPLEGSHKHYGSAADLNELQFDDIQTAQEQEANPYPPSVVTSCYYELKAESKPAQSESREQVTDDFVAAREWEPMNSSLEPEHVYLRPCKVLSRHEHREDGYVDDDYTVQMLNYDGVRDDQKIPEGKELIVTGVPRAAIEFTDLPYTTDMHLSSSFRHSMMLDDDMFPREWKDLRS